MDVGNDRNVPRWDVSGAGQRDKDLVSNNPEVPGVVPVDALTLVARDGDWSDPLIT